MQAPIEMYWTVRVFLGISYGEETKIQKLLVEPGDELKIAAADVIMYLDDKTGKSIKLSSACG